VARAAITKTTQDMTTMKHLWTTQLTSHTTATRTTMTRTAQMSVKKYGLETMTPTVLMQMAMVGAAKFGRREKTY